MDPRWCDRAIKTQEDNWKSWHHVAGNWMVSSKGNSASDNQSVHGTQSKLCSYWHLSLTTILPVCYFDEETKPERAEWFWLYQSSEWRAQDVNLAHWFKSLWTLIECSFRRMVWPVKKCVALWWIAFCPWGNSPCWMDSGKLCQAQHGGWQSLVLLLQWLTGHQGRGHCACNFSSRK